jgi:hypothetical protein
MAILAHQIPSHIICRITGGYGMNITIAELAIALHDHQNYPFVMPESVSFDKLTKEMRDDFMRQASELFEIMEGYKATV